MLRVSSAFRAIAALALSLAACGEADPALPPSEAPRTDDLVAEAPHDVAVLELEGLGEIRFELLPELAPRSVENFIELAEQGFYDGTTFHRVVPGFVIQGGDPNTKNPDPRDDGRGGPGYTIPDEFNALPHRRGVVAMANRGGRDSAGSQFFVVHRDAPHLDGHYTAFGRVISGIEVVDAISELEIDTYGRYGPRDRPYPVDARIARVRIERAQTGG